MKTFYRVGNFKTDQGLWYAQDGTFTGLIHGPLNFCANNALKMEFDPDLVGWLSATDNLDDLYKWFTKEDILRLQKHGWYIQEYRTPDYRFYERFQHYVINQKTAEFVQHHVLP